jgi:hypothetical protein
MASVLVSKFEAGLLLNRDSQNSGDRMTKAEWARLNRERGELIDRAIARTLTTKEAGRLKQLEAIANEYLQEVAPRSTERLEELEAYLAGKVAPGTPDSFSKRLRVARNAAGLSQDALAATVGCDGAVIGRMEMAIAGRLRVPTFDADVRVEIVKKLAEAMGVRPEWLAFGTGARRP